jgi:hypothetical protein
LDEERATDEGMPEWHADAPMSAGTDDGSTSDE